ncbi:hypothetical protein EG329_002812 [Mollisiaceae sp. DMI_Dod_QoI]|nr:hypothetical protein EG329_002812 [Helotiales sp. DMI_Dod_QoI]
MAPALLSGWYFWVVLGALPARGRKQTGVASVAQPQLEIENIPTAPTRSEDLNAGVTLIVQDFTEGCQLFKKWRKGRAAKKAVGQEELDTSLFEGKTSIEAVLRHFSVKHGLRFKSGDKQSINSIINIRTEFRKELVDALRSSVTEKDRNSVSIDPIALRSVSEATRKDTLQAMDEFSRQLDLQAAMPVFKQPDPGDLLPPMPLRPIRPSQNSASSSQTSLANPPQINASSSQTSFTSTPPPIPPKIKEYAPQPIFTAPIFDGRDHIGTSQAMIRKSASRSALSRMFALKPQPYYMVRPHSPPAPVIPSYKCTEDGSKILDEGRESVARLWAAADSSRDRLQVDQLRVYPHSAPLPQGPWQMLEEDEIRSSTPLPYTGFATLPSPDEPSPPRLEVPMPYEIERPSPQSKTRIRSEPAFTFSAPTPRFRRNLSGPQGLENKLTELYELGS